MADKNWKKIERDVASLFNAKRVPLSGSNSGHDTTADVLHDDLYVEVKYRKNFALAKLFIETEKLANKENKTPVVAIKQRNMTGVLFIVRPEDLAEIAKYLNRPT